MENKIIGRNTITSYFEFTPYDIYEPLICRDGSVWELDYLDKTVGEMIVDTEAGTITCRHLSGTELFNMFAVTVMAFNDHWYKLVNESQECPEQTHFLIWSNGYYIAHYGENGIPVFDKKLKGMNSGSVKELTLNVTEFRLFCEQDRLTDLIAPESRSKAISSEKEDLRFAFIEKKPPVDETSPDEQDGEETDDNIRPGKNYTIPGYRSYSITEEFRSAVKSDLNGKRTIFKVFKSAPYIPSDSNPLSKERFVGELKFDTVEQTIRFQHISGALPNGEVVLTAISFFTSWMGLFLSVVHEYSGHSTQYLIESSDFKYKYVVHDGDNGLPVVDKVFSEKDGEGIKELTLTVPEFGLLFRGHDTLYSLSGEREYFEIRDQKKKLGFRFLC